MADTLTKMLDFAELMKNPEKFEAAVQAYKDERDAASAEIAKLNAVKAETEALLQHEAKVMAQVDTLKADQEALTAAKKSHQEAVAEFDQFKRDQTAAFNERSDALDAREAELDEQAATLKAEKADLMKVLQ